MEIQPSLNMGIVGHVDHGKTTLTKMLSKKWTDTHSEEIKRGITIKIGYSNFDIYYDTKKRIYTNEKGENCKFMKKISIVDAPGHESLISTTISGSAIMDCAILIIAADEKCPQPQTREHLKTLEIAGIKDIIIVQNKIDMITKERAIESYHEIKEFVKGTIAENSPIIPISAEYKANKDILLEKIVTYFKDKNKKINATPIMYIIRSFDINKPGTNLNDVNGGILGGSIKQGELKIGDEIEIKPGITTNKDGKMITKPLNTKIISINTDKDKLKKAISGGSVAILTELDPYITKSDQLVGQIVGLKGTLPESLTEITIESKLLDKVIGTTEMYEIKPIILNEILMLIVNGLKTVGVVTKTNKKETTLKLKKPVIAFNNDKAALFRRFSGNKWHIIGHGIIKIKK